MIRRLFIAYSLIATLLLLSVFFPGIAYTASTIDCHCFRDRSFSTENPAAFDPYLLTTVQNRLLAQAMGLSRKEIVREKMSGVSGDHLWVAHQIARGVDASAQEIIMEYNEHGSWRAIVTRESADLEILGSHFVTTLAKEDSHELAWAVVTQIFEESFSVPEQRISDLRSLGASLKEAILVTILAQMNSKGSLDLFSKARKNGNWGSVSIAVGTSLESIDAFLAKHFSRGVRLPT